MAVRRLVVVAPGLVIAGVGVAAVAGLADSVRESNGLAADDPGLAHDVLGLRTVELTDVARALTFLGDVPVLMVFTLIAALVLWRVTKSRRPAVLLLVAMAGSAALTYGIKLLVERQRPGVGYVLGAVDTSYSFPSGHTLNSAVFFLTMAGLLWMLRVGLVWRIAGTAIAVLLSVGIGLSRIYLGYHWATDILAGWLLAATWLSLVATGAYYTRRPGG
ncbi:phosphatase PAP2 family protein [Kribbella sp. NBC_01510]|uniref:phosphatase PAP2 family protein n=1 Tax=unclassified Kribbella TaxID=2644121 RepID=UPI002E3635CB|nr:phosphatase PAP2 family protein [Kribbella sp. NBC_01484]